MQLTATAELSSRGVVGPISARSSPATQLHLHESLLRLSRLQHNVLSLCQTSLRFGSLDLCGNFSPFFSLIRAAPSLNARYSFTMIKAIFYSKFDTQEGKNSDSL